MRSRRLAIVPYILYLEMHLEEGTRCCAVVTDETGIHHPSNSPTQLPDPLRVSRDLPRESLGQPQNQVQARVRLNDGAHLAHLERKRCILKWFLHLTPAKHAQIASLGCRRAVGKLSCKVL